MEIKWLTAGCFFLLIIKSFCKLYSFCLLLVDADEIKRLGKRFKKLDLDNSGSLSVEEFMSLPELQQNPLVQRVIDIFDTDGNGEVDFKGKEIVWHHKLQSSSCMYMNVWKILVFQCLYIIGNLIIIDKLKSQNLWDMNLNEVRCFSFWLINDQIVLIR